MSGIAARGLTVSYGRHVAVAGVDVAADPGQITALVGGDGAGKTSVLRALGGTLRPAAGELDVPPRDQIGVVPAERGEFGDLTVAENLAFVTSAHGLTADDARARATTLLDRTGLAPFHARLAAQLSGGMRRKLALAMALVHRPAVLLLDEPTTGVDPVSRHDLWRLLTEEAAVGRSVLLATTYLEEAARAHRVTVLDRGRVLADGPPDVIAASLPGVGVAGPRPTTGPTPDPAVAAPLARAAAVTRRFGAFTAVDEVDLEVRPGEVVGLLGANGAGKTTLIRLLLGLLRPTSGSVEVLGRPPHRDTRQRIGYVPQTMGLYGDLSVAENLGFHRSAFGRGQLTADGLPPDLATAADRPVAHLSLGQQRRLAFAVALDHDPDLLVLDEPTSGVGPLGRGALWDVVRAAADDGRGVLVTTHHLAEAEQCDRLVVMAAGRVAAAGTVEAIVGDTYADAVRAADWTAAIAALEERFVALTAS